MIQAKDSWCKPSEKTFSSIAERDIDLILLEELRCSCAFRDFILSGALQPMGFTTCPAAGRVLHSVSRSGESRGETDLLVEFDKCGHRYAVLIENKIDAATSDRVASGVRQMDRYRAEILKRTVSGEWRDARLLVVAPEGYPGMTSADFDCFVSYEKIREWFYTCSADEEDPISRQRMSHRYQMFDAALGRAARGWAPEMDTKVTRIWAKYAAIAQTEYPQLRMKIRGDRPGNSYTVTFDCLPRLAGIGKCQLYHLMERGNVDVMLPDCH